jgi:hypothetical protein
MKICGTKSKRISKKSVIPFDLFQHVQSDPPTAKSLAQLISQMIQFQEENFGKGVKNPPITRMPVRSIEYIVLSLFLN